MVSVLPAPVTVTVAEPVTALPFTRAVPAVTVVFTVLVRAKSLALPMKTVPERTLPVLFKVTLPGLKIELAATMTEPVTVNAPVLIISPERLRASNEPAVILPRFRVVFSVTLRAPVTVPWI